MGRNDLSGIIPESIGNLENATFLSLSGNNLSGTIPASIVNLKSLKVLYLYDNQLTGSLPDWLSNLNNLTSLIIRNNQLTGCYDGSLAQLCNQLTNVTNNSISDGNNFDASWVDFCNTSGGLCGSVSNFCGNDANTLLLLPFNNTLNGIGGETPLALPAVDFVAGMHATALSAVNGNQTLNYAAKNNINLNKGTIETWLKPKWNGNDGKSYALIQYGSGGGLLIQKDGANNLRLILNRYSISGFLEMDVSKNISDWQANQWKHIAFTWGDGKLQLYIDGKLEAEQTYTVPLATISDNKFQVGMIGPYGWDGLIDNLQISKSIRSQTEINSFMNGCIETKLADNPIIEVNNFPNPFTNETTIEYTLPNAQLVTLFITDMMGKKVATLLNNEQQAKGYNTFIFDGNTYSAGIYYYTLQAGDVVKTGKMFLMK